MTVTTKIYLGDILHFAGETGQTSYTPNGALCVGGDGKVIGVFTKEEAIDKFGAAAAHATDYTGKVIMPGFIDTHVHYAQTPIIAAYGEQLLTWLQKYAFPAEIRTSNIDHARATADVFLARLLESGTTTALVFGTVFPESVDAFFESCERYNLRMICGKVLMDRTDFTPPELRDTPQSSYDESAALIRKWHGRGRLSYAVTPRFAVTSTPEQLDVASRLLKEFPGVYMHTHMNENVNEISLVKQLFESQDYCSVYHKHGLMGERSVFAHCVHMQEEEWKMMADTKSVAAFCPTSNLFLGSGLFALHTARARGVRVGLGTDVGGGTSFCHLQTLNEAYKVMALQGERLDVMQALRLATFESAHALSLGSHIGNFDEGKEADFIVLDPTPTPLLRYRVNETSTLEEKLFVMMMLGDERCVLHTYVNGVLVHSRHEETPYLNGATIKQQQQQQQQ